MSMMGGKRGRKTARSVKRERYKKSFFDRYKVEFLDWPQWKKEHTPAEVHERRERARM